MGIETSCDETAAAIIEDGSKILSNTVASQVDIHRRYGGVVPEVASRQHLLSIIPIIEESLIEAGVGFEDIGGIAATTGPGLAGSLLVGVNTAKAIALARNIPIVGINHLEGHIYANWIRETPPLFPALCLIVSGGHTNLVLMKNHGSYVMLGHTRDDAAGEAFDKAARILGLGYPGGPAIDKAAREGVPILQLPRAWLKGTNDFSFSGLKTALLRLAENGKITNLADAAASFQEAVVEVLVKKTAAAARTYGVRQLLLAGGVSANSLLRQRLKDASPVPLSMPPMSLCTDNAAMIAACGYFKFKSGYRNWLNLDVVPNLKLV